LIEFFWEIGVSREYLFSFWSMKTPFTLWAFGIIRDEQNRVLLCLRNDYDFWNLPGGWLETWESPREAVIREVKEETGFDVEVIKLTWMYSKSYHDDLVFVFDCKIIWWEITLNTEARDIKYFWADELPVNTHPKHIERINDALKNLNTPLMKNQIKDDFIQNIKKL